MTVVIQDSKAKARLLHRIKRLARYLGPGITADQLRAAHAAGDWPFNSAHRRPGCPPAHGAAGNQQNLSVDEAYSGIFREEEFFCTELHKHGSNE